MMWCHAPFWEACCNLGGPPVPCPKFCRTLPGPRHHLTDLVRCECTRDQKSRTEQTGTAGLCGMKWKFTGSYYSACIEMPSNKTKTKRALEGSEGITINDDFSKLPIRRNSPFVQWHLKWIFNISVSTQPLDNLSEPPLETEPPLEIEPDILNTGA